MSKVTNEPFATESGLADDLLIGAKRIAEFIGRTQRWVYYAYERKLLPLFKFGGHIAARKSRLRQYLVELERGGPAADLGGSSQH